MSLYLGRCGIDVDLLSPSKWNVSGDLVDFDVTVAPDGAGEQTGEALARILVQQLAGLVSSPDERVVPVVWDAWPQVDGFYEVLDIDVKMAGPSLANGMWKVSGNLRRVSSFGSPLVESHLVHGLRDGSAVTAANSDPLVGVPGTAVVYRRGSTGLGALNTRTCEGGTVEVDVWAGSAAQANAEWQAPPAGYYQGAAQILTGLPLMRPPVTDLFTRADDVSDLNEADTGQTWVQGTIGGGVLGISSNAAYCSTAGALTVAYVDNAEADGYVEAVVTLGTSPVAGVMFRGDFGVGSMWFVGVTGVGTWALSRYVGGSLTIVDTCTGVQTATPNTVRAEYSGSAIRVLIDGVEVMSATDAALATETQVGILLNDTTGSRVDSFDSGVQRDSADVGTVDEQLALYTPVIGRQVPGGVDPDTQWCLTNGLVRVVPSEGIGGSAGTLSVQSYAGSAYESSTEISCFLGSLAIGTFTSVTILRNAPEACTLRLGFVTTTPFTYGTLDLTVRRGDRMVQGVIRTEIGGVIDVQVSGAATSITGGARLTSDDADGNRWVLCSAIDAAPDVSSGTYAGLQVNPATLLDFGYGVEIGGSGSSGIDDDQALANQYAAAVGEYCEVVEP